MYGKSPPMLSTLTNGCSSCYKSLSATLPWTTASLPCRTQNFGAKWIEMEQLRARAPEEALLMEISKARLDGIFPTLQL